MDTLTVYTTGPGCQCCKLTKALLARRGVPFTEVDIRQQSAARQYVVDELGYTEAPVVVVDEHDHWSGFRPDQIDRIART
jgi:glutaredoxin-like protein NrdH